LFRFLLVDIGQLGRFSDGGTFANSSFGKSFENNQMSLPDPTALPSTAEPKLPYVMVGDEAFPLKKYLMRPYPGRYLPGKLQLK